MDAMYGVNLNFLLYSFLVIIVSTCILYYYSCFKFINMNGIDINPKIDYINITSKNILKITNHLNLIYKKSGKEADASKLDEYIKVSNILDHDEILEDIAHRYQELNYYPLSIRLYYKLLINKIKKNEQDRYSIQLIMNKLMILYSETGDAKSARFMFEQSMSINRNKNAEIKLY